MPVFHFIFDIQMKHTGGTQSTAFFIFILYEDAIEKEKSMNLLSYIIY